MFESQEQTESGRIATLPQGEVDFRDIGTGPVIVFVHGLFLNGAIWDEVVVHLAGAYRCIVPELPLGSHKTPMNAAADLSLPGVAQVVAQFLEQLDLRDVTLVGMDFGGVVAQLAVARHGARIGRLVLTNCDALEVCPAKGFAYLGWLPYVPGAMWTMSKLMRHIKALRQHKTSYAAFSRSRVPDRQLVAWVDPMASNRGVRRDVAKVLRSIDRQLTLALPDELRATGKPVLLAWGADDHLFPLDLARRLRDAIGPAARLVEIPDAQAFVAVDAPQATADAIADFAKL